MKKSKVSVAVLASVLVGFVAPAKATGLPADCDPAVYSAMTTQAQQASNNASLLLTSFLKAPTPTMASMCNQMVNSVWNPQRFAEEAILSVIAFPMAYSYSLGGFSLSFNPVNALVQTTIKSALSKASLNFICTDSFDGIGNALRNVSYDPVTGNMKISAKLDASGPLGLFGKGIMSGATISFTGNPSQIAP